MRYATSLPSVLFILIGLVISSAASAQTPTTRPADGKILILPFSRLNPEQSQAWLGRSIQQSLLADLTVAAPGRLLSSDSEVADMPAAADLGRKTGAAYVIQGSFITLPTSAGEGLRIMGEVVEVNGVHPIAAFKATGLYSEIFRLEDQIATQIRMRLAAVAVLPAPPAPAPIINPAPEPNAEEQAALPQVNEYYQAYGMVQPNVDPQAYYNYYLANPYTAGGYGYGNGIGLGLGTGFFFGSYYGHGSNFGGFNEARFGVHDHNHFGSHGGGGGHVSGGGHGGHR